MVFMQCNEVKVGKKNNLSNCHEKMRQPIGGLVNVLHILLAISQFHGFSGGSVTIYCNCKSAINKLQKTTYGSIKDLMVPDYDLLQEGKILLKKIKGIVSVKIS
jgi:hypothetical protein